MQNTKERKKERKKETPEKVKKQQHHWRQLEATLVATLHVQVFYKSTPLPSGGSYPRYTV
jgi:hypothetical protein